MLCYRDVTFCHFHTDCADGEGCWRALTDEVRTAAEEWWGTKGDPPICMFAEYPDCYVPREETDDAED